MSKLQFYILPLLSLFIYQSSFAQSETGQHLCVTPTKTNVMLFSDLHLEDGEGTIGDFSNGIAMAGTVTYTLDSIAIDAVETITGMPVPFNYTGYMDSTKHHSFMVSVEPFNISTSTCIKLIDDNSAEPLSGTYIASYFNMLPEFGAEAGLFEVTATETTITYTSIETNTTIELDPVEYTTRGNGVIHNADSSYLGTLNTAQDFYAFAGKTTEHSFAVKKPETALTEGDILGEYFFALWGQNCGDTCSARTAKMQLTLNENKTGVYSTTLENELELQSGTFTYAVTDKGYIELTLDGTSNKLLLAYSPESHLATGVILKEGENAILTGFRNTKVKPTTVGGLNSNTKAIYPILSQGAVNIAIENSKEVLCYNQKGACVYKAKAQPAITLPGNLANGVYTIQVVDENGGISTQKIILSK